MFVLTHDEKSRRHAATRRYPSQESDTHLGHQAFPRLRIDVTPRGPEHPTSDLEEMCSPPLASLCGPRWLWWALGTGNPYARVPKPELAAH
jgi:hypothetical protein